VVQIDSALFAEDAAAQRLLKEVSAAADDARARLIAALGTATAGEGGDFRIRISQVETSRFDAKTFMAAHPEMAEQFMVRSAYARTTVGKKKGQGK
jgi:predicted phage-related endonuclease